MSALNLCPMCGAPAPPPPAVSCRYCRYTWVVPGTASSPSRPAAETKPAEAKVPAAPSSSFAGLGDDEVLARARHHLGATDDVHLAPGVPAEKERAARAAHAGHLPPDEPVLVLFDATLFGGGDDGYLLTARRVCWKDAFANPQAIPWRAVATHALRADEDSVHVANTTIPAFEPEHAARLAALLLELSSEAQRRAPAGTGRARGESESPDDVLRQHLGVDDSLFYAPAIPAKKEANARRAHRIAGDEVVLALFDDTVFGAADEGFVVTARRLCWTNHDGDAKQALWPELRAERLTIEDDALCIDGVGVNAGELDPRKLRAFVLAVAGARS